MSEATGLAIGEVTGTERIQALLARFDQSFPRTISSRVVDLDRHARKLAERAFVYAATRGDRSLGFVAFYANDHGTREAFVSHVAVDTKTRRLGIGRRLMAVCIEVCRSAGMRRVRLEVDAGNRAAQSFYERLGFRVDAKATHESTFMTMDL